MTVLERMREHELMDDPSLDPAVHAEALRGLARINGFTGAARLLYDPIKRLSADLNTRRLSILDIAAGSGDMPSALYKLAKNDGIELEITATDISPQAVQACEERMRHEGVPSTCLVLNALDGAIPKTYDVITTSLFLHHLDENAVVTLLQVMKSAVKHLIVVNDLVRSRLNLFLVFLGTRLLSQSPIVHFDGPASVRAAFTQEELSNLAQLAGLKGSSIEAKFPGRMVLTWRKNDSV